MTDASTPHYHDLDDGRGAAAADAVRRRAYELWASRGGADGDDVADWLAAERELAARRPTHPDDVGEPPGDGEP